MKQILLPILMFTTSAACAAPHSPYVDKQHRAIKSLSADEISGYTQGKGMGFSMAAELNHFPGPRHVLELKETLDLSDDQIKTSQQIFDRMQVKAQRLGNAYVEAERNIEVLFSSKQLDTETLNTAVKNAAEIKADLRLTHLNAHIAQTKILSQHQIHLYNKERGYHKNHSSPARHGHHH